MWNPLSWVMEAAAIMAIALANGGGKPPDWQDFVGIVCLLVINSTISFIEENNAGNAAAALMAGLAPKTKARAGIREVHFFPFNPVDKRTALTYIDERGNWHRTSKGAPEQFDFSPFMVLIIAILNDGTIMTISKDRVKPSPLPDSWKLKEIFATGIVLGGYLALMTVVFFWIMNDTDFFTEKFGVRSLRNSEVEMMAALYLQVSIVSQALIFVTRSRSWSFIERPGLLLLGAFLAAQLVATLIAVYAEWEFARIKGVGWGWAGVIWLYSIVFYFPLDIMKFAIRYILSGKAWRNLLENKTAFTTKKDYGKEEREAQWALAQRTLHGLQAPETSNIFNEKSSYRELSEIAEQAKRRAEVARLREVLTLKGHVESVVKLKGLDIDNIQQHYTV
ncbi:hypothetical protein M8C21_015058 [Ambrosia artemisiifolia]|uniref:Uncharacterized protein n=1 Tax=Ambrosia artemisiifolia TaxID=4212 RepID=A0AAD5D2Q6_AMBAR|nr:hypothetical protein M8C21_015058 [Ambrosia artemisiifolia]